MTTLHIVSHTHWDREWYLPFQTFRLKLVHLIDHLLDIFADEPEYQHFMLDGQAIVLEDYLAMRPQQFETLRQAVQSGRLLIGPWYILPDEFLVSPEATIRNLLQGERTIRPFGRKMMVGYLPDPFGHIGQMPQILKGFGIKNAALRRGLDDEPGELWWQAPDGSRVLLAYMRDGYGNAAHLPASLPDWFARESARLRDNLLPHLQTQQVLLMYGTDHTEPAAGTGKAIEYTRQQLEDTILHSTLPAYLNSLAEEIKERELNLPVVDGELRSSKRHDLLPGVLSTRIDIKQRNHACENLLERWAEPSSAWVERFSGERPAQLVRHAWKTLLENHPHDSICGCSVDSVYEDVHSRFTAVEQIAENIIESNLRTIARNVATLPAQHPATAAAVVVFNASPYSQSGLLEARLQLPIGIEPFELVSADGTVLPAEIQYEGGEAIAETEMDAEQLRASLGMFVEGRIFNMSLIDARLTEQDGTVQGDLALTHFSQPDPTATQQTLAQVQNFLDQPSIKRFHFRAQNPPHARIRCLVKDVPALGYTTLWMQPARAAAPTFQPADTSETSIENELLRIEVNGSDGSVDVTDQRSGTVFRGINRFVDGGDCGDLYNYCPPYQDQIITARLVRTTAQRSPLEQVLTLELALQVPEQLTPDRQGRSAKTVELPVITRLRLLPGLTRIDIQTEIKNQAQDHRLRVHFTAPFKVKRARQDGHFEVVERSLDLPVFDDSWQEHPRPEVPQRLFSDIARQGSGLMVANQGLPEVEVLNNDQGEAEIALTLLRCTGWLAREDLPNRKSLAGPPYQTPGAQMQGSYSFEYAVIPHLGDWRAAAPLAYGFDLPLRAASTGLHDGTLPHSGSFFAVDPQDFVVTAVKTGEDEKGVILRGINRSDEKLLVRVRPLLPFQQVQRVSLDESASEELAFQPGEEIAITVRGHEILSLKFS